jgi:hypothetical protein
VRFRLRLFVRNDNIHHHTAFTWFLALRNTFFIFSGSAAQRGLWPLRSRGIMITLNDASQSVGLLWTSDQLVTQTST